tara:strand:- start:149 stop:445 length:297 start_codon:yes stop_codon:yes gene_type:complete
MSEESKTPEITDDANMFENSLKADHKEEYEEIKVQYKAARRNAKTIDERKQLMRIYQDELIELAVSARIAGALDFNIALNQEIKALDKRLYSGGGKFW